MRVCVAGDGIEINGLKMICEKVCSAYVICERSTENEVSTMSGDHVFIVDRISSMAQIKVSFYCHKDRSNESSEKVPAQFPFLI